MPEVSVIIPTYNSGRYVTEAVNSVLRQSFDDFEVIVIDDGSTDDTQSVMSRYGSPVRYIRQENSGVSRARNRGIEESRGRYVAFLDADDTWLPNKLEKQITAIRNQQSYRACYSAFLVVDSRLTPLDVNHSKRCSTALEDLLLYGNVVGTPGTVLCERALFDKGAFDPELSQCADWDMWVRLAVETDFLYLDEPLICYRQHDANMSRNAPLLEQDSLLVLEKGFGMPDLPQSLCSRKQEALARNYMVLAGTYFQARRYSDFVRCATKSMAMDFRQVGYLAAFPLRVASRLMAGKTAETL